MYCTRKITENLTWVGGNDRRLAMFEGVYSVPNGVSYNSYLLADEKTVLFDTVDKAVGKVFFENLEHALSGRTLDYVVVQHMEPDHSATLQELALRYPDVKIICSAKSATLINQFFAEDFSARVTQVKEGDTFDTGDRVLTFYMAPMVHWPEVMVTYDAKDKILFTADAFGAFGALNGALFADEVDFMGDYLDEARRYYANIVGKYGPQVQALLKKAAGLEIAMLCPLHGFVWRKDIESYIEKYQKWSTYTPEEQGVMIAYASIYGNTENAAEILACGLRERGIRTAMFDVSVSAASDVIAAAFRYSHLVFASSTYNAGIFVSMEDLLHDLAAHNLQNRTVALIQNGSWAPASGKLMREILSPLKNFTFLEETLDIRSSLKPDQLGQVEKLADAIAATMAASPAQENAVDSAAMRKFSYGLFVITAREGEKDNGCICNTVIQITEKPKRISLALNKANYTTGMIRRTGQFNVSVLSEEATMQVFQRFGFRSGRDTDKFENDTESPRSANGIRYIPQLTNTFLSCRVISTVDCGTHLLFLADVTEAKVLSDTPSATYAYYFAHIKPKPRPAAVPGPSVGSKSAPQPSAAESAPGKKKRYICKICGYIYEGETLPPDFICPICKHGAEAFELMPDDELKSAAVPELPVESKPAAAPQPPAGESAPAKPKGFICTICGYIYEGETLPPDFICPICKHGAEAFEPLP